MENTKKGEAPNADMNSIADQLTRLKSKAQALMTVAHDQEVKSIKQQELFERGFAYLIKISGTLTTTQRSELDPILEEYKALKEQEDAQTTV